ncbi:MAG: trimethylamine methyltransferase family protein, partial [Candidatus Neomarinimicrobiota bacterium]
NISGPGMLDFESCQSLEKLVMDNEICGLTLRLVQGITPRDDFPALPHFQELLKEQLLLIADHTLKHIRSELHFPGPVIERANRARWEAGGSTTLRARAHAEVEKLLKSYVPSTLSQDTKNELVRLMETEARRYGQDQLPERAK